MNYAKPTDDFVPTLDKLGATVPEDVDAKAVTAAWFKSFASSLESHDIDKVVGLFIEESYWRDMLALTWDFRTFHGTSKIRQFLSDQLKEMKPRAFELKDEYLGLQKPYPDIVWINAMFNFETETGLASGVLRLVPTASGDWKAFGVFTNLENLKGFPEKVGHLRSQAFNHGKWATARQRELEFRDSEPTVLIIGGGQSGLEIAARLKCLDITSLIIEKNERVGDNWRHRYEALCLHDPVWYDHMPYIPFPPTWPVFTPALKLANWLEHYVEALELNVWTSTAVTVVSQGKDNKWTVAVKRGDGQERTFVVNHVIFACGLGSGEASFPKYPGMDKFKGQILHSTQHKKATDHAGKKVVIVGACTSAHDLAVDYYQHGVDVTMYQRGSTYVTSSRSGEFHNHDALGLYSEGAPPTDISDRMVASFPHFKNIGLAQRQTRRIAEADKLIRGYDRELLDALTQRGFQLNMGIKDTGFGMLAWSRAGDTGASGLIADGKIKLKSKSQIESFTENGIKFDDGSELQVDVVVFATGIGSARDGLLKLLDDSAGKKLKPIWGFNEEGEINGAWRDLGLPRLWTMMGNLAFCRFYSRHVALQVKAIEEGVFGTRYSAEA
ncbi:hypothetical protein BD779DRAFT_1759690 [Infundibulicybe gibba]|nr:hypothetical protein BD779DRAFT_1759690 [Infundibulicybe gibba]